MRREYDGRMAQPTLINRVKHVDPLVADGLVAIVLTILACLQIWAFESLRPHGMFVPPDARLFVMREREVGLAPYLIVMVAFLPLTLRRVLPWAALALSAMGAGIYSLGHFPPAFTVLAPLIAVYSVAAYARRRHTGVISLLVVGMAFGVVALAFSSSVRLVMAATGTFALFAAVALLGDSARNRREYVEQVEMRAFEAERTREEEALRRVEEERLRIAREVHDIVAHSLSIVAVQASAAETVLDKDPAQAREAIKNIRATSKEALGDLRSMLDVLRTGEGDLPLAPAADLSHLEQLAAPVREAGIDVALRLEGDLESVPAHASVSAYRIVQESLTNAVRHSGASNVVVAVRHSDASLSIDVFDDGRGSTGASSPGHGIEGMRERVEALGGTFSAGQREEGTGFAVHATIPLTRSSS